MPPDPSRAESKISRVAGRQHRQITRTQLLELGVSSSAIGRRTANGYLHRQHHGVYAVGCPAGTPIEHAAAAVLACGGTGALDALWAIALWDFAPWPSGRPQVVVTSHHARRGIRVRYTEALRPGELRTRRGIRVTSPARAILDSAPLLGTRDFHEIVNRALRTPRLRRAELEAMRGAHPRHPGAHRLDWFIESEDGPSRAWWETVFPELCVDRGLPRPRTNVSVCGHTVDAVFDDAQLVVELDSWTFHGEIRDAFEDDRDRDANLLAGNYAALRITWRRLTLAADREFDRLHRIIAQRTRLLLPASREGSVGFVGGRGGAGRPG